MPFALERTVARLGERPRWALWAGQGGSSAGARSFLPTALVDVCTWCLGLEHAVQAII
jgi:hypothetical protein